LGNDQDNIHFYRFAMSENIAESFRGGGYICDSHFWQLYYECTQHLFTIKMILCISITIIINIIISSELCGCCGATRWWSTWNNSTTTRSPSCHRLVRSTMTCRWSSSCRDMTCQRSTVDTLRPTLSDSLLMSSVTRGMLNLWTLGVSSQVYLVPVWETVTSIAL